jgi:predicted phage-related endonuclease
VAIPASGENVMDRGHRLEQEAVDRFMAETGKKVNTDLVLVLRSDNSYISYSPDGRIGKTEDVEVKCLNSASHIEAWYTKKIPRDYWEQILHGFVVNDSLKTRYMVFYDPRMPVDFFYLTIHRKDVEKEVVELYNTIIQELELIAEIEKQLLY